MLERLRQIRDAFNWGLFAYRLVVVLGLTGVASAIGGSVWAVIIGVPIPIALMAGYCTLVGAIYLAMAPLAYRALAHSMPAGVPVPLVKTPPDYRTWSYIQFITVSQAAYLWSGQDPNSPSEAPEINMWAQVMKDAIKRKELRVTLGDWADESDRKWAVLTPKDETTILRRDLKTFAKSKGWEPDFLKDY